MTLIVQACIVVVTIALVVMAMMTVRMMRRVEELSRSVEAALVPLHEFLETSRKTSQRIQEVLVACDGIVATVRTGTNRLAGVVDRAGDVADTFLTQVERPLHTAVALMQGVRAGANVLVRRWSNGARSRHPLNEGDDHV